MHMYSMKWGEIWIADGFLTQNIVEALELAKSLLIKQADEEEVYRMSADTSRCTATDRQRQNGGATCRTKRLEQNRVICEYWKMMIDVNLGGITICVVLLDILALIRPHRF